MDKDAVMFLIGSVFAIIFFVLMPILLIALSRHDFRADDSEHLGPTDFTTSDFENMSSEVQSALIDFSTKRITPTEFNDVVRRSRTS